MRSRRPAATSRRCPRRPGEDLVHTLLNAASDHALLLRRDGTVLACNRSMAAIFHLDPGQLAGERIYDFFSLETARKWAESVDRALDGQDCRLEENLIPGLDLETRMHRVTGADGEPDRVAVFSRDVTARKAAERERTRLASAIEQTADAVIVYDENMRVEFINQSFEALTGYSLKDVRGCEPSTFYVGPEQRRCLEEIMDCLARGDIWTGRVSNTCKDNKVIRCEKTLAPIRGKGGSILGYVSVWRDVTEVEILERQLRRAQKMEALGTLAGGIAHDFNNILAPIVLLADIGLCRLPEGDPLRSVFERILKATKRAGDLVRQILGLSRRHESDHPMPVRLATILEECLKLLRPTLPSTIAISLELETKRDVVLADPSQIHQIVINLCTNAAWAMRGSGGALELRVTERDVPKGGDRSFPCVAPGPHVLLSVRDTGHGIDAEHMEHIFEPFFTTRGDGSGTGLGLAVVQNIVDQLRGGVRVRSKPGSGTCFEILLPRSEATAQAIPELSPVPLLEATDGGRILVVDDEVEILDACTMGLTALGYEVTACSRGEEALSLFRDAPHGFDLALTDATMPGMTGPDLVRELLKIEPHLPIILASGHSDLVSREKAWKLGALEYLDKPYGMDQLVVLVRRLLGRGRRSGGEDA
ncbi:MAG: PAS domain-containing protein [Desulfovibrio aminophilus]|uniref:hybrid sensor histidine kinase/response regulator n=1 Tax=Desulfovibrio aminophilus TaxID=81425 RepID=UPI0039EA1D77